VLLDSPQITTEITPRSSWYPKRMPRLDWRHHQRWHQHHRLLQLRKSQWPMHSIGPSPGRRTTFATVMPKRFWETFEHRISLWFFRHVEVALPLCFSWPLPHSVPQSKASASANQLYVFFEHLQFIHGCFSGWWVNHPSEKYARLLWNLPLKIKKTKPPPSFAPILLDSSFQ